jgi:hypothetical protein
MSLHIRRASHGKRRRRAWLLRHAFRAGVDKSRRFGFGSFTNGTVTVHSIDATRLVLELQGTDSLFVPADGVHEVHRCVP